MKCDGGLDISVIILTRNEEERIGTCLGSVSFAREVVVIDSGSTDKTCEVAEKAGARVVNEPWPGDFSAQRNRADTHARFEWVFHLDADETVTDPLAEEISSFFERGLNERYGGGRIPRKEIIFGKWVRYGGWYPQYKLRLYRRGNGAWVGRVHERYDTEADVFTFESPIVHDSYESVRVFLDKFNRYSSIDAEEDFAAGKRFSLLRLFFVPLERFFGRYIRHGGFRDGFHGFTLAFLIGFNYFLRYLKLWEKHYIGGKGETRPVRGKDEG